MDWLPREEYSNSDPGMLDGMTIRADTVYGQSSRSPRHFLPHFCMSKTCDHCRTAFEVTQEDRAFYEKMDVPEPRTCHTCRLRRRLMERNARHLYYTKCALTGKQIISQYREDVPFPIYSTQAWWSDDWDATSYGRDVDFSRPFFEQFKELLNVVPHLALFVSGEGTMINSEYNNCAGYLKNCYLIAESDYNEDCFYSNLLKNCKSVCDCSVCYDCERCYECIDCLKCYNVQFSQDCQNCSDSFFLKNCIGCRDCICCMNQRQKQYMILNKQYTKEEYEKLKASMDLQTRTGIERIRQKSQEFFLSQPHKAFQMERTQDCVGDHLYDSKNAYHCFDSKDLEDCRYCAEVSLGVKSCMDYNSWGDKAELVYQSAACGDQIYNLRFCSTCITNVYNADYCVQCTGSSDLFGCVGIKKQKYCILNKQYTKEEYEKLRSQLIEHMKKTGEWGEYFPQDLCPFSYNESIAMDYVPLSKADAEKLGWNWREEEEGKKYLGPEFAVPDRVSELTDDVTGKVLMCEETRKPYKIIAQELAFYRSMNIPAPKLSPDARHLRRMEKRNPHILYTRECKNCSKTVQSTFAPNRKEVLYCEECYLKSVY